MRSPSTSVTKREESSSQPAAHSSHDEQKTEALLHTAPAALTTSGGDSAAGGGGAPAELTHAKKAKRAGRTKAVSRPTAGTLRFAAFSDVSKASDMKAAVTLVGGEEKKEAETANTADGLAKDEKAAEVKQQAVEPASAIEQSSTTAHTTASPSTASTTPTEVPAISSAAVQEAVNVAPSTAAARSTPAVLPARTEAPASETKAEPTSAHATVAPTAAVESSLETSSASIHSEDLDSSFSSVTSYVSTASLDSSFSGEQLSVYNAAADYFQDAATLGYNPAMHARYSTLLHTGATFHRWQATGSSAKRLLYLSDCATYLCLLDSKKRLPLDKVETKRPHARSSAVGGSEGQGGGRRGVGPVGLQGGAG